MNNNYREFRMLNADALRSLCIKHDWYTRGTNEEYEHLLFDLADKKEHLSTEDIIEIAKDILVHSDTEYEIENIAFEVARTAVTFFDKL